MGAGILDIVIEQGATFERVIRVTDPAGVAVNLTSVTSVRGQVRRNVAATDSYAFELSVTNAASGIVAWGMTSTVSASIPVTSEQSWSYDIELVRGTNVERLLQGVATISPEITR